jgi:hypothetical protein
MAGTTWMGALIAAPAVIAAIGLAGLEAYRQLDADAALFGGPAPRSVAESIAGGYGVEETYAFIREGLDPNAVFAFSDPDHTEGVQVSVSPLMLAIAAGDSSAVRMLLTFGARLDLPSNRLAPCLARELQHAEIIAILDGATGGQPTECPPRPADAPTPLVAWASA